MATHVTFSFQPVFSWPITAAIAIALVAASIIGYRKTYREITPLTRFVLVMLRLVALASLLLCFARPTLVYSQMRREKAAAILLLDQSRSMRIRDMEHGRTRGEACLAALSYSGDLLNALDNQYSVHRIIFDKKTRPWKSWDVEWSGTETAIGTALEDARRICLGRKVAGIILFTDGSNNYGPDPTQAALRLRDLKTHLYAVGVGTSTSSSVRDFKMLSVVTPARVFAGNSFPVEAEFHAVGMQDEDALLKLVVDGKIVNQQTIYLATDNQIGRASFLYKLDEPGQHSIAVRASPLPREMTTDNNEDISYIRVIEGGLRVLFLDGKLRTEFGFIRRALETDPQIVLNAPLPFRIGTKERLLSFLLNEDISKYHVFMLGDIPASIFPYDVLLAMRRAVGDKGAGLAMLGGYENFGPGGYAKSPLAEVLPVKITTRDGQSEDPTAIHLTAEGENHFLMRLDTNPDANVKAWSDVPRLKGFTKCRGPDPAASVLAVADDRSPLVVVKQYGKGRSAAIMVDTTYRWILGQPPEKAAKFRRFWRQLIRWLAAMDKETQKAIRLSIDKFNYALGETVRAQVEVTDENGDAIPDAVVRLQVRLQSGDGQVTRPQARFRGEVYSALFAPRAKGTYRIVASAKAGKDTLGPKELLFRVTVPDREFDRPQANMKLVKAVAETSGGSFHGLEDLDGILKEMIKKDLSTEITQEEPVPVWDTFPIFFVFVLALVMEWVYRRQKGLV